MKRRIEIGGGPEDRLKIYSIIKREQRPKSLLLSAAPKKRLSDFSWPPKNCRSIHGSSCDGELKK